MRRPVLLIACLAVVSALYPSTLRAASVGLCDGSSCLPSVIITIGNETITPALTTAPGQKTFTIPLSAQNNGVWELSGVISTDADPFIQYSIGFTNSTGLNQTFSITILQPFVGGPYDSLLSSHSSTVTDGTSGAVTVLKPASTPIHSPSINFVQGGGLGLGCGVSAGVSGFSAPCETHNYFAPFGPTLASGVMSLQLSATVSPTDSYAATGRIELLTAVPEPGTLTLFGIGLCVAARRLRRSQAHGGK